jgi:hypothetical protein
LGRLLERIVAERESAREGTIRIIRENSDQLGRYRGAQRGVNGKNQRRVLTVCWNGLLVEVSCFFSIQFGSDPPVASA